MERLHLDLLRGAPRPPLAAWLLLAAGLGLASLVGWRYLETGRALAAEQEAAAGLQPAPAARPARATPRTAAAETGRTQLDLPWGALFARLEHSRPAAIALVALEADGRKREAGLTAEARSPAAMLDYLARLRREPGLAEVTLVSHAVREDDPQRPLRFALRFTWRP